MRRALWLAALLGLMPTHGYAQKKVSPVFWNSGFKTGNDLLRMCDPDLVPPTPNSYGTGCLAYILGVVDSSSSLGSFRIPDQTEVGQLAEIVVTYLIAHPEIRQKNAASIIIVALHKFYPAP